MSTMTMTTPAGRMASLARAELTLLARSKGTLFAALFVPLVLPFSVASAVDEAELKEAGLSVGTMLLPSAVGFSLIFAVYGSLIGVFVARREELVLKRLRTGELRDHEILLGASLPAVAIGLAQCLVISVGCVAFLDAGAPGALHYAVLGVLLGTVMFGALAAVTASFSRTSETAQVMSMPLIFLSMLGSGLVIPFEVMPDGLASVCERLPLSPVIQLVRGGWTGSLSAADAADAAVTAVVWTLVAVSAVRRWFRWEPRH
ncbi:ABC transporter permease [Streptomyces sp. NPDC050703]|uniref:ABC transporter permease n=1 Tax=Streptomyces sp. NPDC050703 TaxID=3157218 RepID=UPI003448AE98